jgi:outer membrane protein assembly factor BamB
MAASALVDGGVAYIGTDGKTLHAVDAGTGILKWTWDAPDKIQTTPVVVGGAVVFGCNDNFVYAIEIK